MFYTALGVIAVWEIARRRRPTTPVTANAISPRLGGSGTEVGVSRNAKLAVKIRLEDILIPSKLLIRATAGQLIPPRMARYHMMPSPAGASVP